MQGLSPYRSITKLRLNNVLINSFTSKLFTLQYS
nr:MAG TPA_asm: hypothetical protein [Caudoviricetes sp.]